MDSQPKSEESDGAQDYSYTHQNKTEFWLIHSVVFLGELDADPVVEWAGNHFSDDGQDERRESSQARFPNGEVIRRLHEDDAVDD